MGSMYRRRRIVLVQRLYRKPRMLTEAVSGTPMYWEVWQKRCMLFEQNSSVDIHCCQQDAAATFRSVGFFLTPIQTSSSACTMDVNNLTSLIQLDESAILDNLRHRYVNNRDVYTYCGIILVAINPYTDVPVLYSTAAINSYRGQALENVNPHVYSIAEAAMFDLERESRSQTIIVSGESGAGKTMSAKHIMRYLATVSESTVASSGSSSLAGQSGKCNIALDKRSIEARVLATNPVLEAFGNAKTVRNNNSSRFGKLIRINFDQKKIGSASRKIRGSKIVTYLLEKSRVVSQSPGERNFHIFYQLLSAARQSAERRNVTDTEATAVKKATSALQPSARLSNNNINPSTAALPALTDEQIKSLGLQSAEQYNYLNQSRCYHNDDLDDLREFELLQEAMSTLGVRSAEQFTVWKIIAAVLHLGNITIEGDKDVSIIANNDPSLERACDLLGIDTEKLVLACTRRRITVKDHTTFKMLGVGAACASRDAMAKHIYAGLFNWLVRRLCTVLMADPSTTTAMSSTTAGPAEQQLFIGILDIYGFESFANNSFEQLCINFANEHLQQLFVKHVFKLEQEEYVSEGLGWTNIDFCDNTPCISLIESKLGVFDLLDEECKMPNGNDGNWFTKITNRLHELGGNSGGTGTLSKATAKTPVTKNTSSPEAEAWSHLHLGRGGNDSFIVKHYANDVEYKIHGFVEKNRDDINADLISLLQNSRNTTIAEIYCGGDDADGGAQQQQQQQQRQAAANYTLSSAYPGSSGSKRLALQSAVSTSSSSPRRSAMQMLAPTSVGGRRATVSIEFRQSLHDLITVLSNTTPHFIRCIKPNDEKMPFTFEDRRTLEQLRACGVLETVRIAAAGFPIRWPFNRFIERYWPLAARRTRNAPNLAAKCQVLINVANLAATTNSSSTPASAVVEQYKLGKTRIFLRTNAVALLERLRQEKFDKASRAISHALRFNVVRARYLRQRTATINLQAAIRGALARQQVIAMRQKRAAIIMQRYARGWLARKRFRKLRKIIVLLQAHVRGNSVRFMAKNIRQHRAAIVFQKVWRGIRGRRVAEQRKRNIIIVQCCVRRYVAKRRLRNLKVQARSVEYWQKMSKGLENKLFAMQRQIDNRLAAVRTQAEQETSKIVQKYRKEIAALEQKLRAAQAINNNSAANEENKLTIQRQTEQLNEIKSENDKLKRKLRYADLVDNTAAASAAASDAAMKAALREAEMRHQLELQALQLKFEQKSSRIAQEHEEIDAQRMYLNGRFHASLEQLDDANDEIRMLTMQLLDEQALRAQESARRNNGTATDYTANEVSNATTVNPDAGAGKGYRSWLSLFTSSSPKPKKAGPIVVNVIEQQQQQQQQHQQEKEDRHKQVDDLLQQNAHLRSVVSDLKLQLQMAKSSTAVTPLPSISVAGSSSSTNNNDTLPVGACATNTNRVSDGSSSKRVSSSNNNDSSFHRDDDDDDSNIDGVYNDAEISVAVEPHELSRVADHETSHYYSNHNGYADGFGQPLANSTLIMNPSAASTTLARWDVCNGVLILTSSNIAQFCKVFFKVDPYIQTLRNSATLKASTRSVDNNGSITTPPGMPAFLIAMALRYFDREHDEPGIGDFFHTVLDTMRRTLLAVRSVLSSSSSSCDNRRSLERESRVLHVVRTFVLWYSAQCVLVSLTQLWNVEQQQQQHHVQLDDDIHKTRSLSFVNFDLTSQLRDLKLSSCAIYETLCKILQEALRPFVVPALVEYNSMTLPVPDYTPAKGKRFANRGGDGDKPSNTNTLKPNSARKKVDLLTVRSTNNSSPTPYGGDADAVAINACEQFVQYLQDFYEIFKQQYHLPASAINNLFRQLTFYITATVLNLLMISNKYCSETHAQQLKLNVEVLRDWLRNRPELTAAGAFAHNAEFHSRVRHSLKPTTDAENDQGDENWETSSNDATSASLLTVRAFAVSHTAADMLDPIVAAAVLIMMGKSKHDLCDRLSQLNSLSIGQITKILMNCNVEQFCYGDDRASVVDYVRQRLLSMETNGERRPQHFCDNDTVSVSIDGSKILTTSDMHDWPVPAAVLEPPRRTAVAGDAGGGEVAVDLSRLNLPAEYLRAVRVVKF